MGFSHVELLYILQYGYIALFAIVVASELSTFLPVGILLIAMGALVHQGYFNFWYLLVVSTLASVIGDYIVFSISRRLGKHQGYRRYVKNSSLASRLEGYVGRYPEATIFLSRLVGFAGTPANAIVGLSQTSRVTYLIFDTLGNLLCCAVYLSVGYYIGAAWEADARIASFALGMLVAVVILSYLFFYFIFRNKKGRE